MKIKGIAGEAATMVSGNLLAQLIALAAYFVLTRIYSPDDYGLFNIFYSYIEVFIILSTCKYELAVVVADDEREAAAVSRFALRLNTVVSLLLLTVALVLWLCGALPGNFSQLGWMVLLIPPMVFFCGTSRIYSFLYNRFHRYRQIALSENVNAGSGALLKIALGLLGINTFSANLPFLWLALYFNRAEIGLFGLALTFTRQPVLLLCAAFERVLYARGAEAVRQRQPLSGLVWRFLLIVNAVALPVAIAAWFLAEPVFAFGFGARWQGCGVYVQAVIPWILLTLTANSLMFVANIFSTQRTEFFFNLAQLLLRVVALYIGIRMGSFLLSIRMFAAVSALVSAALTVWYLWQVRRYDATLR